MTKHPRQNWYISSYDLLGYSVM